MLTLNFSPETIYLVKNEAFEIERKGNSLVAKGPIEINVTLHKTHTAAQVISDGKMAVITMEEGMEAIVRTGELSGFEVQIGAGFQSCFLSVKAFDITFENVTVQ